MYDIKQVINGMFKSVDDLAAKGIVDHSFKVKVHHGYYRLYLDYFGQEAEVLIDIEMAKSTFSKLNENITTMGNLKGLAEVGNAYIRQVNYQTTMERKAKAEAVESIISGPMVGDVAQAKYGSGWDYTGLITDYKDGRWFIEWHKWGNKDDETLWGLYPEREFRVITKPVAGQWWPKGK